MMIKSLQVNTDEEEEHESNLSVDELPESMKEALGIFNAEEQDPRDSPQK